MPHLQNGGALVQHNGFYPGSRAGSGLGQARNSGLTHHPGGIRADGLFGNLQSNAQNRSSPIKDSRNIRANLNTRSERINDLDDSTQQFGREDNIGIDNIQLELNENPLRNPTPDEKTRGRGNGQI
uniref:Uncharacterized protein n=1 Tax=Euplotes crassus TaxID=5936 RepID=A0A7S3KMY5_EUPCR|mmetsp:Transcript_35686/g.35324  ORF Transcript_35686/g.35324 Transcript_35686/m.35324 type:complete len:126 (+) Transcript_35686:269-646(+)